MRFFVPIVSLLASVAVAQSACNVNCILIPTGGLQVTAGQTFTISWSNPSAGQITIKLQNGNATPTSGITLASNVDASLGKYTVTIPSNLPASATYNFETIDQSNTSNINFSNNFSISGATGVSTMVTSTASSASSRSSSASASSSSASSASSSSSASSASSSSSSSSSASRTSSQSASSTSASATASITTSAPNSRNGASGLKAEGALVAMLALAVAAF